MQSAFLPAIWKGQFQEPSPNGTNGITNDIAPQKATPQHEPSQLAFPNFYPALSLIHLTRFYGIAGQQAQQKGFECRKGREEETHDEKHHDGIKYIAQVGVDKARHKGLAGEEANGYGGQRQSCIYKSLSFQISMNLIKKSTRFQVLSFISFV